MALTALHTYTDGISDAVAVRVNDLHQKIDDYLAHSHPAYAPNPTALVSQADAWRHGLRRLGEWTNAVGNAFLAADQQPNNLYLRAGHGHQAQLLDSGIIADLPAEWRNTPYLGVRGGQLLDWQRLMSQTGDNPEKAFVDLLNKGATAIPNDPANQLAVAAGLDELLAKNTITPETVSKYFEKEAAIFEGASNVIAAVESFRSQWRANQDNGTISLPANVFSSLVRADASVVGGLVGGARAAALCGPDAPVCAVVFGVLGAAFGGFLTDAAGEQVLSPAPSAKSIAESIKKGTDAGSAKLEHIVDQQATKLASSNNATLGQVAEFPLLPLLDPSPSTLYPDKVAAPLNLPFPFPPVR
jgi:hypothetical protein